jgi:hypothetical protein
MINRSQFACPMPPVYALSFRTRTEGEAHGIRVGDKVRFNTTVSGISPVQEGLVVCIEIFCENIIGLSEDPYARFYINRFGAGMAEIRGVSNILEIIE